MRFRTLAFSAVVPVLAGCGTVPIQQRSLLPDGVYEFDQHQPEMNFSGHVEIAGDSLRMLDTDPKCFEKPVPPALMSGAGTQQFTCGPFNLLATRGTTGRWTIGYTTTRTVKDVSNVCSATTTSAGRTGCTETQRQSTERQVTEHFGLELKRVTDVKAP